MTASECKVQLEETDSRTASGASVPGWKLSSTLLLLLTLCLTASAAAVLIFNAHGQEPAREDNGFDIHHALRQISNVRAAIHLEGQYNPELRTSVEWRTQVDQSHSQGGLKLDHNEIEIPQSGLYFVYSQASFRVSCSSRDDDDLRASPNMVHLSHTVQRWTSLYSNDDTKKTYDTILHSVRTACQKTSSDEEHEGSWFTTIYMGAVFNLSSGDRLRTRMEEKMLQQLEDEPGKTFFGVFAL